MGFIIIIDVCIVGSSSHYDQMVACNIYRQSHVYIVNRAGQTILESGLLGLCLKCIEI